MGASMPRVEISYITEAKTSVETSQVTNTSDDKSFKLVDEAEFTRLFESVYPIPEYASLRSSIGSAGALWHHVMGNHPVDPKGGKNPDVHYLTDYSAELIIKHIPLFRSGIDFQNLPKGFFLTKNPNGRGVRDLLHFSQFVAENQTQISSFAIVVSPKNNAEILRCTKQFNDPQSRWYEFLLSKSRDSLGNNLCSQVELDQAFIRFANLVESLGLEFYALNSTSSHLDVNPIVLLGRMSSALKNAHLKEEDVAQQWKVMGQLPLFTGYEAIRVLSDHRRSQTPCGFLVPEMNLTNLTTQETVRSNTYFGAKTIRDYQHINGIKDFWRYIAFQPKRNSIGFYREAITAIDGMNINNSQKNDLYLMLAGGTTGDNYRPVERSEEDELQIWQDVCRLIDNIEDLTVITKAIKARSQGIKLKDEFIHHITRITQQPNIAFLDSIVRHINAYIGRISFVDVARVVRGISPLTELVELSNKLNRVNCSIGTSLYNGVRFYLVNREWHVGMDIKKYVELQYEILQEMQWLAPYLSTFGIMSLSDVNEVKEVLFNRGLTHLQQNFRQHVLLRHPQTNLIESPQFKFVLSVFKDASQPIDKNQLLALITDFKQAEFVAEDFEGILNYLEMRYQSNFPANYFDKKRQQVRDAKKGLFPEQIALLDLYEFSDTQKQFIIQIESAMSRHNYLVNHTTLSVINDKFALFQELFLPEEYSLFLQRLADIREQTFSVDELNQLLSLLIAQRSLLSFNAVFLRNAITPCQNGNLITKIIAHMEHAPYILERNWTIDPVKLQEAMAGMFLKLTPNELYTQDYGQRIERIIDDIYAIIENHPHIQDNLLNLLSQVKCEDDALGYLHSVEKHIRVFQTLNQVFPAGDTSVHKENMIILYSLISHSIENPEQLVALIEQIQQVDNESSIRFFLTYLSRLLDRGDSVDEFDELVRFCLENSGSLDILQSACAFPPYPGAADAVEWLKSDTFVSNYQAYSLRPYGERNLNFAFDAKQYVRQRSGFSGIAEDMFTNEVGRDFYRKLEANRSKSIEELRVEVAQFRGKVLTTPEDIRTALCLSVEFLARTAPQAMSDGSTVSQELNTTQLMALYAMLMQDNPRVLNQIDTGEGKSRIMMVLAAINALQGKTVDLITSDISLAERDFFECKQYLTALEIRTGLISLNTPPQLYQKGGVNFSDNAQLLLLRNRSDIDLKPNNYLEENRANRCLLVDEVDHFKHDKSKDSFNYACKSRRLSGYLWIYPHLVGFMKSQRDALVQAEERPDFNRMCDNFLNYVGLHDIDLSHQASLERMMSDQPEQLVVWLRSAFIALHMENKKDYVVTEATDEKLYPVRDHEGFTRYTRKVMVLDNGRPLPGSSFADGVHQCLCVIENEKAGREEFVILAENETQRATYAKTFMGQYDGVYGVSGTTRKDAPLANPHINYENYQYITTPRERQLIRENLNIWAAKDEAQQIEFAKREILKTCKNNRAVLLACRDDQMSERVYNALAADEEFTKELVHFQHLHSLTESKDEKEIIKNAGRPGSLTVSSIGLSGRGVDVKSDFLETIGLFPASISDEVQLSGRSGRYGKPGQYRLIVNVSDLEQPLNGQTYNIANEVDKVQKEMAVSAALEEEVCVVYSEFLEAVHQAFLADYAKTPRLEQLSLLTEWQDYLGELQKDWEVKREDLMESMKEEHEEAFIDQFTQFTREGISNIPDGIDASNIALEDKAKQAFQSYVVQKGFFKHGRQPLKVQRDYDPSDDGQARIYSSLFAQTRAVLCGERSIFANFYAWREGRGELFPDLMATLRGERAIFANLRATIARLVEWVNSWFKSESEEVKDIFADEEEIHGEGTISPEDNGDKHGDNPEDGFNPGVFSY